MTSHMTNKLPPKINIIVYFLNTISLLLLNDDTEWYIRCFDSMMPIYYILIWTKRNKIRQILKNIFYVASTLCQFSSTSVNSLSRYLVICWHARLKWRKLFLNPWYLFYYISTGKEISLKKLQFHSYLQLVLIPACTTFLFLPVLAASVTCFSADLDSF